jgi:uncharacterized protein YycO
MKIVTFGFSRAKSKAALFSRAIMWAQGTTFSHVYIRFNWPAASSDLIYQASKSAVNFETPMTFDHHAQIVHECSFVVSDDAWKNIAKFIVANLGKPYSLKEICGFALKIIGAKLGYKFANPAKNGRDEFICSELAADLFKSNIMPLDIDVEDVGPKEFYEILIKEQESTKQFTPRSSEVP